MKFISSIRRNYDSPKTEPSNSEKFTVTGGNAIITAGGYRIHMFLTPGDHKLTVLPKTEQMAKYLSLVAAGGLSTEIWQLSLTKNSKN
jgi:hypothetical protein